MRITVLQLTVADIAAPDGRSEELEFIVDSGAIYSVVPAVVLQRLGIRPIKTEEFRLADGSTIRRNKGFALFKLGDRVGGSDVIFGEAADAVLLGALTLESLGLALDPLRRQLKPIPLILASATI